MDCNSGVGTKLHGVLPGWEDLRKFRVGTSGDISHDLIVEKNPEAY